MQELLLKFTKNLVKLWTMWKWPNIKLPTKENGKFDMYGKIIQEKESDLGCESTGFVIDVWFSVSSSLWGSRAWMGIVLLTLVLEKWTRFSKKNLIVLDFSGVYLSFQVYKVWYADYFFCTGVDLLLVKMLSWVCNTEV